MRCCAFLLLLVGAAATTPEKVCFSITSYILVTYASARSAIGVDASWESKRYNHHSWSYTLCLQVRQPAPLGTAPTGHHLGYAVCLTRRLGASLRLADEEPVRHFLLFALNEILTLKAPGLA